MEVGTTPALTPLPASGPPTPRSRRAVRPATGWLARGSGVLRAAAPALVGYALARIVGLLVLFDVVRERNLGLVEALTGWDAGWYLQIADRGYDRRLQELADGRIDYTNLAFFPLYPGLIKGLALAGLPPEIAGLAISFVAGLVAAWGLFAIGDYLYDRRVGAVFAVLWAVLPHAVVESMVYAESLFTALAAWSLFAVMRRRWLLAGTLCLLAGLTRPTAAALVAVVGLGAAVALLRRQDGWRPWVCAALAPVGLLGFLAFVAARLGRVDGWFHLQRTAWISHTDDGSWVLQYFLSTLKPDVLLGDLVVTVLLATGFVLLVVLVLQRAPAPLVFYAVAAYALTVTTAAYYFTKGRLLLPAFPLLLPLAVPLARAGRGTLAVVLPALALASGWYGAFLLTQWPYAL
jgi:hypothetical protein